MAEIEDPKERAMQAARAAHWSWRPAEDVREIIARRIEAEGRDRSFWLNTLVRMTDTRGRRK